MISRCRLEKLILVDPWKVEWNDFEYKGKPYKCYGSVDALRQAQLDDQQKLDIWHDLLVLTAPEFVEVKRMTSEDASKEIEHESLDFVFIDAVHLYDFVIQDITCWWPKVKPGGMIAGDDYTQKHSEVITAVDEMFPNATIYDNRIWTYEKPRKGSN